VPQRNAVADTTSYLVLCRPAIVIASPGRHAIGRRSSAIGHRPSAIGHQPSAIGHRPSAIGHRPSAIDHRPSAIGHATVRHLYGRRPHFFAACAPHVSVISDRWGTICLGAPCTRGTSCCVRTSGHQLPRAQTIIDKDTSPPSRRLLLRGQGIKKLKSEKGGPGRRPEGLSLVLLVIQLLHNAATQTKFIHDQSRSSARGRIKICMRAYQRLLMR
jgi:hypothetical protein